MSWTVLNSGTQAATLNTEHTLATETVNGTYFYMVDISNLAFSAPSTIEAVELRMYVKCLSTGALKVAWKQTFDAYDALITPIIQMPPLASPYSAKFTLKQLNVGTGRNFDWSEGNV